MLLVECNVLEKVKVINEGTNGGPTRLRLQGKFQQCDEQNNNGRIYPKTILESQVKAIQEKIGDRSLVGALDHPANDAIHLSQASHLITKLWLEKDGSVMGECEILSTPNGKIVEALINDGVKIGISSRGVGSVTEGIKGKIVNEDFKLITFDLVSDPSTRGAFPELTESIRENSQRAQDIVSKHKKNRVLATLLESKISEALKGNQKKLDKNNNGELDSQDFMILRKAKKSQHEGLGGSDEGYTSEKEDEQKRKEAQRAGKLPRPKPELLDELPSKKDSTEIFGNAIVEAFKELVRKDERSTGDDGEGVSRSVGGKQGKGAIQVKPESQVKGWAKSGGGTVTTPGAGHRRRRGETADQYNVRREKEAAAKRVANARSLTTSTEIFGNAIIEAYNEFIRKDERCWKGYKPVKGKKPYSKGSCTKEGYEQFGKSIVEAYKELVRKDETRTVGGELGSQGQGRMSPKAVKKAISYTPEEVKANDRQQAKLDAARRSGGGGNTYVNTGRR
jgi:hypothetical protein